MSKIALSAKERSRMEAVATELDLAIDEFLFDAHEELSPEQWELLLDYARACVRRVLEIGVMLHGVVDANCTRIEYPGRGREVFVREALAAWRDAFAPVSEVWKLAPVFAAVPGGERRALADIATLEVMAVNRMFGSLDAECAEFLA